MKTRVKKSEADLRLSDRLSRRSFTPRRRVCHVILTHSPEDPHGDTDMILAICEAFLTEVPMCGYKVIEEVDENGE